MKICECECYNELYQVSSCTGVVAAHLLVIVSVYKVMAEGAVHARKSFPDRLASRLCTLQPIIAKGPTYFQDHHTSVKVDAS